MAIKQEPTVQQWQVMSDTPEHLIEELCWAIREMIRPAPGYSFEVKGGIDLQSGKFVAVVYQSDHHIQKVEHITDNIVQLKPDTDGEVS